MRSKAIEQLVIRALETWPATRSNDRKLILAVWWLQDNNYDKHFPQFFMDKAAHPETIRRYRQKLQEHGKYLGSKQATEARYKKFESVRAGNSVSRVLED